MTAKLLSHHKVQTSARYAHRVRNSLKPAAERMSDNLLADLDNPPNGSNTEDNLC